MVLNSITCMRHNHHTTSLLHHTCNRTCFADWMVAELSDSQCTGTLGSRLSHKRKNHGNTHTMCKVLALAGPFAAIMYYYQCC